MRLEPSPPYQALWPNNRYMAKRRCLNEHQWTRERTCRDYRPTLKPLVQNFHPVRSSWCKNSRINAHIFGTRVLLSLACLLSLSLARARACDRLKQVATAAASLLLFCHAAPPFHESARFIVFLQNKSWFIHVPPSCALRAFILAVFFYTFPIPRIQAAAAEPCTAFERTHLAQWACLHER